MKPSSKRNDVQQWSTRHLLNDAALRVSHIWDERLAHLGITYDSVPVLQELAGWGAMRSEELAVRLHFRDRELEDILQCLEDRGLIDRGGAEDPGNHIRLTSGGSIVLTTAENVQNYFDGSDAHLLAGLRTDLRTILRNQSIGR
ncbi:hypothetical protein E2F48_03780 [Arthrobacter crusticola]|uniref:MarR family transcriptional regulator n=1 Tax=Arthrobacter crusticola TaxID=2547960 RepID=A0A4R5U3R5_9MICC|nr:hypothetical protein [Arthrobacter crusticola]TDK28212.1 hypothetical protein E2F48_03780 [Arthrobacter crusticola]